MSELMDLDSVEDDVKVAKVDLKAPSPFAELDTPTKGPLIMYLLSLAVAVTFGVLLALNNGQNDLDWTLTLSQSLNNSGLAGFLAIMGSWTGGLLVAIGTAGILVLLGLIKKQDAMKYGSLALVVALIGLAINQIITLIGGGLSLSQIDEASFQAYYTFSRGTFTSFKMTIAGVFFVFPYCFNSQKLKTLKIISGTLAFVYVVFVGLALIASEENWISDVLFAGVLQYWFATIIAKRVLFVREQELYDIYDRVHLPIENGYRKVLKAKATLSYQELDFLYNKINNKLSKALVEAQDKKEKGKEISYLSLLSECTEIIQSAQSKLELNRKETLPMLRTLLDKVTEGENAEKAPAEFSMAKELIEDGIEILEDNKAVALKRLDQALDLYEHAIEAAENEPGDFGYVIKKAKTWIGYVERFKEGLEPLPQTSGNDFEDYMKLNFLYII